MGIVRKAPSDMVAMRIRGEAPFRYQELPAVGKIEIFRAGPRMASRTKKASATTRGTAAAEAAGKE